MIINPYLGKLISLLVELISKTWRIRTSTFPPKPSVIVFWHRNMLPVWKLFKNSGAYAVVSLSSDGEILSNLLKKWGYRLIRGSSSKGGKEVLTKIIQCLPNSYVLITPDGPKGPKNKMKPGAVISSLRTGVPLFASNVNIGFAYSSKRSWDNFIFPLPFSKINVEFIGPFVFEKTDDRKKIENYINSIENLLNS